MIGLIGSIVLLLVFSVIPYAIAVVMPNWRWLLGLTLIAALLLAAGWSQRWMIGNVGPCGGFGPVMLLVGGVGLAVGMAVCGLTLLLRLRGFGQRRIDMVRVAGTMIAPAIILLAPEILALSGL
jgi:hypothetical protein